MATRLEALLVAAKEAQIARKDAAKIVKDREKDEEAAFADLQAHMEKEGLNSFSDRGISATINNVQKPYIVDYSALESFIVEHRALDLLQKRLTESAVKLRWDDGIHIPGVGISDEKKLVIK